MLDTTPVTAKIRRLISTGTTEQALLTGHRRISRELCRKPRRRPSDALCGSTDGHEAHIVPKFADDFARGLERH
jgi:hypothetical protein